MGWLWNTTKETPESRDASAEAEFDSWLSSVVGPKGSPSSSPPAPSEAPLSTSTPTPTSISTSSFQRTSAKAEVECQSEPPASDAAGGAKPPSSIHPYALVPKTMSCRDAFDYAWFCQSPGGQWVNVYRYGEMRSCSEHWSDFWFCMRTKSYSESDREAMIAERQRDKLKRKYGGHGSGEPIKPSSEDVWQMRTVPVKEAFSGDFAELESEMRAEEKQKENGVGL